MPDMRVPCRFRLEPPLTLDEARFLNAAEPGFDDTLVRWDNLMRVYQRTGVCWCAQCRERRGE
jgi:hypothetical protein